MKINLRCKFIIILTLGLGLCLNSSAQIFKKIHIYYGFPFTKITETTKTQSFDEFSGAITESRTQKTYNPNVNLQAGFGVDIPLAKLGENSAMVLGVGLNVLSTSSVDKVETVINTSDENSTGSYSYSGPMALAYTGLPLTLGYLRGPDAYMDKSTKMSYSVGFGVMPAFHFSTYLGTGATALKLHPYLKAEVGSMMGILFKVRGEVAFGNVHFNYGDQNTIGIPNGPTLTRSTTAAVSILIYPLSFLWGQKEWWRR